VRGVKTAFVTGATGFIGGHLVRELVREGWRVVAPYRSAGKLGALSSLGSQVELTRASLLDPRALDGAIPRGADCVFHLAASTNVWRLREAEQIRSNVEATRNVVDAAIAAGAARFVHCSSEAVYGTHDGTITEDMEKSGRLGPSVYHRTKYIAERTVLDASRRGLSATVVSPAHVLGPEDRGGWARMIAMIDEGTLPAIPPGSGSFCDARDVARAMRIAAERGRASESYLIGGHDLSFDTLCKTIAQRLGCAPPTRRLPAFVLRALARGYELGSYATGREPRITPESVGMVTHHMLVSSKKAERELDYRARPLEETLDDAIAWMRREGTLRAR
jgi:dihydroflavonol-4-reductase